MGGGGSAPKPGLVVGGNMSGLSQGLAAARPKKMGRVAKQSTSHEKMEGGAC